jgi:hypothetical protein
VFELVARGGIRSRGFLRQEEIPLDDLLATPTGALFTQSNR